MIQEAEHLIQEFVAYVSDEQSQQAVLSLYLVVDPADPANQAVTPAWQIYWKNALREIESKLERADWTRWEKTKARVERYLADYHPTGKTLVLFAGPQAELEYELPLRLENVVHYGWPQVTEFLWALDEYEQYLVLLVGQDQARGLIMFLGQSANEVMVNVDQTWQRKERKTAHFDQMVQRHDEIDRRFLRYIAGELNRHFLENPDVERIILGGNTTMAHALRNYLHPTVADNVIDILAIPLDKKEHEIAEMIREVTLNYERENELAIVNDIVNRAKSGGRGAVGEKAVNKALDMQAVSLLVLPYPMTAKPSDELFVKAIRSSSDVEFVHGEAADRLTEVGGIAVRLYHAI